MAIRVGIIGNGGISNCHMSGYQTLGDRVEVVACCDINEERAKSFADRYQIAHYYTDCKEMLAAEKLDIVSVCTWNSAHAECTIAALDAGCHVICEKPMAMNAKQAADMKAAAERNGKLLMVGFVRRQGEDAKKARQLAADGTLGDIYYAKALYLRRRGNPGGWFGDRSRSGGGALIDLGVHVIDMIRYIMGCPKPVSVYGVTFDKLGPCDGTEGGGWVSQTKVDKPIFDVEDLACAMIKFDNGAVLHVECSFNLNLKSGSGDMYLYGTKAGLSISPFELYTDIGGQTANIQLNGDNGFDFDRDFKREIRNFVDAVEGKAECLAPAEDGVVLMQILDAVYESARTGKVIEI